VRSLRLRKTWSELFTASGTPELGFAASANTAIISIR
jgi:hypothetical protein